MAARRDHPTPAEWPEGLLPASQRRSQHGAQCAPVPVRGMAPGGKHDRHPRGVVPHFGLLEGVSPPRLQGGSERRWRLDEGVHPAESYSGILTQATAA